MSKGLRGAATALAVVVFAVGCVLVSGAVLVRGTLLDDEVYMGALARADVHHRLYTEVLIDPELADTTERLVGNLRMEGVDAAEKRALVTNSLRWAVPPSVLRQGTDATIVATLAYLRGETELIDSHIDLRPVLDRVERAVVSQARAAMASVDGRRIGSIEDYRTALDELVDAVADGRLPSSVPVPDEAIDRQQVADALAEVAARTGADPMTVQALSDAGSDDDAVVVAATEALADKAVAAREELEARLGDGRAFDTIAELAERDGGNESTVVARLNDVRDLVEWFGPFAVGLGSAMAVAGLAALVLLHRHSPRNLAFAVAAGLAGGGLLTMAVWWWITASVGDPLAPATSTGPDTWNLPAGIRGVVSDIERELMVSLDRSVRRLAFVPVAAGATLAAVAALRVRRAAAVGLAAAVVVSSGAWMAAPSADTTDGCNGHVELCKRRYDEVVQAATHNSMSSPDVVQVWPEQDETMREQLDAGIRALLVDTHHWNPVISTEELQANSPDVPPAIVDAVLEHPTATRGRPGTYLCHNHCVWGGVELVQALTDVKDFLDENPREVVTLVVQDAISAAETEDAFVAAGLEPFLHVHETGQQWPTLGEMIDSDERLVVFAEDNGPPPDWYLPAFENIQDTPFEFRTMESFSCAPARGTADLPLFMINHWLSALTPDRRNAALVNRHEVIVDRARRCAAERGQIVNFIAVDFAGIGDVLGAVDELNGVDR